MDRLSAFSLDSPRTDLSHELSSLDVMPADLLGIPLVSRCDSALRPLSQILSKDCWTLCNCEQDPITKNLTEKWEERQIFVTSQHRPSATQSRCVENSPVSAPSLTHCNSTLDVLPSYLPIPPSRNEISNHFIARELTSLREDLSVLKSDVFRLKNCSRPPDPSPGDNYNFLRMNKELKLLHHKIDRLSKQKCDPLSTSTTSYTTGKHSNVTITTWNCRGISNSVPYLLHLFENGTDIVALSEHWLWPYDIDKLSHLHPDYIGFGSCDERLNENSSLTRGCGGVGLVWRKSLHVVPLTEISSDRFCAIQLQPSNSPPITIFSVYLPCSAYSNDTYSSYFQDLQSVIGRYEVDGPIIICGDFNVDVSSHHSDSRQTQLADLLDTHSLYIISQSSLHQGPNYTFFKDSHFSVLDYIVAIASTTLSCFTHPYHPLNLSDRLPLYISLDMVCPSVIPSVSSWHHVNWARLWNLPL